MKQDSNEYVEVTFKRASGSQTYRLQEGDGNMAEMLIQLLSLGDVAAVKLEPVHLKLASRERTGVRRSRSIGSSHHKNDT